MPVHILASRSAFLLAGISNTASHPHAKCPGFFASAIMQVIHFSRISSSSAGWVLMTSFASLITSFGIFGIAYSQRFWYNM